MPGTELTVYVRKSAVGRRLSFEPPDAIPHADLLQAGYTFDGNRCVRDVAEADLHEAQMGLVGLATSCAVAVRFR